MRTIPIGVIRAFSDTVDFGAAFTEPGWVYEETAELPGQGIAYARCLISEVGDAERWAIIRENVCEQMPKLHG